MAWGRPKPWKTQAPLMPKATGRMQVGKGPVRSGSFLARIRQLPCLACDPGKQTTRTIPHHLKFLGGQTQGKKKTDYFVVPLCQKHHTDAPDALHSMNPKHTKSERAWWKWAKRDPLEFVRTFSKEGAEALATVEAKMKHSDGEQQAAA